MPRPDGLPSIGLAIIARDEAATLPQLLESVGWSKLAKKDRHPDGVWRPDTPIDFVVVCDTGSTDNTRQIAAAHGCLVTRFEWCDNFSKAREASFAALPEELDFVLWADCDDVISNVEQLRVIAANLPPQIVGTVCRYDYAQDENGNTICELWRERLIRRAAYGGWILPIHEVMEVSGEVIIDPTVTWHHRVPPDRKKDPERNYKILRADADRSIEAGKDIDPRTLCYLGTEALALGKIEEARERLTTYLERPDTAWSEERCQVAHKLSIAWRNGEGADLGQSRDAAQEAVYVRPDWADGYLDLAELCIVAEDWDRALKFCDLAEHAGRPQTLLIINPLEYEYQPKLMRAVALGALGRLEEALEVTRQVLQVTPQRADLHHQAQLLTEQLKRQSTRDLVLGLRETLVRHDENSKARTLMECIPYFLTDDPLVNQAKLDQREMTLHATDPEIYGSYYRENPGEAPFELQGVPIPDAHETFHRVRFLREGLDLQAMPRMEGAAPGMMASSIPSQLRILDLTANDGWMLANLAEGGYGTDGALHGIEMNTDASSRAREREALQIPQAEVITGDLHSAPEHFEPHSYDAVILFETIEHVPDPEATIELACSMVKPGGRFYISTPDGAYERGMIADWARVESKGHLRAILPRELAGWLVDKGIVHRYEVEQRVQVAELEPRERIGRVDFVAGPVSAMPEKVLHGGLGGSETALCKMAEHFARRGYAVRVFAGEGIGGVRGDRVTVEGDHIEGGNVHYCPYTTWDPDHEVDLCVITRQPAILDYTINAKRRLLWLHDADYGDQLTEARARNATDIVVLSEFQRQHLAELYPFLADHPGYFTSRNGIEASLFTGELDRKRRWAVYSSSPDRGLEVLLALWPRVVAEVPDAQLHYGYAPVYRQFAAQRPELQALNERLEALAAACPEGSTLEFEGIGQGELAQLFRQARVWAYPSWQSVHGVPFPEISCISAMEAQAAGCLPVTSEFGALVETVRDGSLIDGLPKAASVSDLLASDWADAFVRALVEGLKGHRTLSDQVRANVIADCDWSSVADEWQIAFLSDTAIKLRG